MRRYQNIDFSLEKKNFISLERAFPEINIDPVSERYYLVDTLKKRLYVFYCNYVKPNEELGYCTDYRGEIRYFSIPAPSKPKDDELKFRWATVRSSGNLQMFFVLKKRRYDEFWINFNMCDQTYSEADYNVR